MPTFQGVEIHPQVARLTLKLATHVNGYTELNVPISDERIQRCINSGLMRRCRVLCGPLGVVVSEEGVTLTDLGRAFVKQEQEAADAQK